jgi:hypothetical protein
VTVGPAAYLLDYVESCQNVGLDVFAH